MQPSDGQVKIFECRDTVWIQRGADYNDMKVLIQDISGQIIYKNNNLHIGVNAIELLNPGLYILQIESNDEINVKRIVNL